VFDDYGPLKPDITERRNGVLISAEQGEAVAYALWKLQERGRMFVSPGEPLYEGMVIGIHTRDNDLVVNPVKTKQLTNIRAAGKDEAIMLTPPMTNWSRSRRNRSASANATCSNTNASARKRVPCSCHKMSEHDLVNIVYDQNAL